MGKLVSTVTGYITPEEIGIASAHEHVAMPKQHLEEVIRFQIEDLKRAKELGMKTIVDVSVKRDIDLLKRVSEESGIQIIPSTGHYIVFDQEELSYTPEKFYSLWLEEVEHGIGGSDIRPGVIKVGSNNTVPNEMEARTLLAAGWLQRDTGLPLCVHSVTGCGNQQKILEEAGADLSKVYFSHVEAEFGWEGRTLEQQLNYLEDVVRKGSYLSYNNFGNWAHTKPENLAAIIREMIRRGYGERQLATMDLVVSYKNDEIRVLWDDINPNGKERTYSYVLKEVIPWMLNHGIAPEDAWKMVGSNVAELFR